MQTHSFGLHTCYFLDQYDVVSSNDASSCVGDHKGLKRLLMLRHFSGGDENFSGPRRINYTFRDTIKLYLMHVPWPLRQGPYTTEVSYQLIIIIIHSMVR